MLVLPPMSFALVAQVLAAVTTIAFSGVLVTIGNSIRRKIRAQKLLAALPGPKGMFLVGFVPMMVKNLHRVYDFQAELHARYGERFTVPWSLFAGNLIYTSDPKDIEYMFTTNMDNWIKSDHFIASVGEVFGKSLLAMNHAHTKDSGAMYRVQRKLMSRVFTTTNFKDFTEQVFHQKALRMVGIINTQDGKVDMHEIASQYTLQTIFDIGCGVPLEEIDEDLGVQFINAMDFVFTSITSHLMFKPYFRYLWWCMPSEYRLKRESKVMLDLADGILQKRLLETDDEIAKRFDMLSLFIKKGRELKAEGQEMLDSATIRSMFAAIIFAGRDTTTSTILFSFYNLAQYPEQQDEILEELKSVDTAKLTFEDVKKLKYLDAFVWETIRLNPSVALNRKQAAEDDCLPDGTFVPAGTEVSFSNYYMGRNNAKLWGEDQLVFRPERWLEMKTRPTAYEFPVFQAGPRICPGMNMALLETKILIATLLEKFHVKIQDGEQVEGRTYLVGPAMMMKGGLPLQLTPRSMVAPAN